MIRSLAVFTLLTLPFSFVATAQTSDDPFVFEAGEPQPLAGSRPAGNARAGDTYLLSFAVRNRTSEPMNLRRVAFRLQPGLDLVDPNVDRVDNDRNGEVDEGGEGFGRIDDSTVVWRIDDTADPIAPGAAVERAVKVRLLPTAEAGIPLSLNMLAAASTGPATVRANRAITFRLSPPQLTMTLDGEIGPLTLVAGDALLLRADVALMSGQVSDLQLAMKGSPALDTYEDARILTGKGVRCENAPIPVLKGRSISAAFGTCRVLDDAPDSEKFVAVEASVRARDAEPFSDPEMIVARRQVRLAAAMKRGDTTIGQPVTISGRLTGPLIGAQLLSSPDKPVDAGDQIKATYRVVNRGDAVSQNLRLRLRDNGAVNCKEMTVTLAETDYDPCDAGIWIQSLKPGEARDITVAVALRDDALFEGEMSLGLTATALNMAATAFPDAPFNPRLPSLPTVSVAAKGDWNKSAEIITGRIGDTGTVLIEGTLPVGRYPAALKLMSRLVDAETGDSIAPAPVRVDTFEFLPGDGIEIGDGQAELSSETEDGWTVVTLPLGVLSVPPENEEDVPAFTAEAALRLRDLPEIQAGRVVEMNAQLSLFGTAALRSEEWLEVLIVEPLLDLTVRTPDEDHALGPNDSASIAVMSCNRGSAGADGVVLTVRLPQSLAFDAVESARVRTIGTERANDMAALLDADARSAGELFFDAATGVLRGMLQDELAPDRCAALVFDVRRSGDETGGTSKSTVEAILEPFKGRSGAQARIYPGIKGGEIRFTLPSVRFGPVSEKDMGGDPIVAHSIALEIPRAAGPHRLDLKMESNAGLDWTVLRVAADGASTPWRDGTILPAGEVVQFRFETRNPGSLPLGWVDSTLVKALAFSEAGLPLVATTRLITRRGEAPGGRITVTKTMALDRDCDGDVGDERIQDALFETVKDAVPGDCVIFRVAFRHSGNKDMERIVVRDKVPAGTVLRPNAVEILRTPEPSQTSEVIPPKTASDDVVWSFEGLFKPGAEGEVSYAVKLTDPVQQ